MGCGPSQPVARPPAGGSGNEPAVVAYPRRTIDAIDEQDSHLSGKLTNTTSTTDADESSSRETTPNTISSGTISSGSQSTVPSRKSTSARRSIDARRTADNMLLQKAQLPGPGRDYKGLPLERREDPKLSHITSLASAILKAPCAMVVLGYPERMILASTFGIESEDLSWLPEVCAWVLSQASGVTTIEDMQMDFRTHKFPWVLREPNINFYAGTPIHTMGGDRLGVLCVLDFEPRIGATPLCMSLPNLAEMVARELPAAAPKDQADDNLFRAMDAYWDGSVLVNVKRGRWQIKYSNEAFSSMTGINRQLLPGKDLWDVVELHDSEEQPWEAHKDKLKEMVPFEIYPVVTASQWKPTSQRGSANRGSDQASTGSDRVRKYKITMRPNSLQVMEAYSGGEAQVETDGWYFAVFTYLVTNSRGSASAASSPSEQVPFEDLEVGPIIGRGSFGSVFRAVWSSRMVAVKVIEYNDVGRTDAGGAPLEASLMLKMKHPNIVETINFATQHRVEDLADPSASPTAAGTPGSAKHMTMQFWLMLEFCDIGPLSDAIRSGFFHKEITASGPRKLHVPLMSTILETALDIAKGLQYIHSHNILHGDLTAGNVLLTGAAGGTGKRNFVAKIADFGLSRQAITSKVETNTYGTVTHMPPELLNDGILSKAADVYAFGVLLYEMFTTKQVWEGLRHPQIIHAIAVQKKHPEFPSSAPACYKSLADRCMAAEPEQRPGLPEVMEELSSMLDSKLS